MKFNNNTPIYTQIIAHIYTKVLRGEWKQGERVPSVRDLAVEYEVNPNTVMRAYEKLQSGDIIYNRRGLGNYLSEHAVAQIREMQLAEFKEHELPEIFQKMKTLGISIEQFSKEYDKWQENNF